MGVGPTGLPPRPAVQAMASAYWTSRAVYVMAEMGIADLIGDGASSVDDLAGATGAHPPTLRRFLRTLAGLGLLETADDGHLQLTEAGHLLRANHPETMRPFALMIGAPDVRSAWDELGEAVRTGEAAFPKVHGMPLWEYQTAHPGAGRLFDAAMAGIAVMRVQALLALPELADVGTVVDVGGGNGRLLMAILQAHPLMRAVLFDLPRVVEAAREGLTAAGVADRCSVVGGDFFVEVPTGGDAYVLAQVIHDWADEEAMAILRTCHSAMRPGARIWLIEQVVPPGDGFDRSKLMDIHMLVMFGAQERTADEYRALFDSAGFEQFAVHPSGGLWSVVEAVRP